MSRMLALIVTTLAALGLASPAGAQEKIKVEKADDLPTHTYEVTLKPSELLTSEEGFSELAPRVKADIIDMLDSYEIDDAPTLQGFYRALQALAFLEGDYEKVISHSAAIKALESKEPQKLMSGLLARSYIHTRRNTPAPPGTEEFGALLRKNLARSLAELPWDKVQDLAQQVSAQWQYLSENLIVGMLQGSMDASVEESGFLSRDQAVRIIQMRSMLQTMMPVKADLAEVFGEYVASHQEIKKDIWPDREVEFAGTEGHGEVVVSAWDSGVDDTVFRDRMYMNPKEVADGEDNDGNGFIDDIHGISFDLHYQPTPERLYLHEEALPKRDRLEGDIKGFMDLQAGVQSGDADAIRAKISGLEPDEVKIFLEDLNLYGHYAHGTHVAGIMISGNPYAKVLAARLSFDHRMVPIPYTMELTRDMAASFQKCVDYFREHDVRVANMSWGFSLRELEQSLEANAIGESSEERRDMAREMFKVASKGLEEAFKSAPDICFITSAGNSDNDVQFDEFIPSGYELPNLLTVGAVDQAGEATGFTSFGDNVVVYGNGFEVQSNVPGGKELKMSGTSMSSPHVANLAAKLLAVDPTLSPPEVFRLIKEGAEDRGEPDQPLLVIHPQKSLRLLKERMGESE